MADQKISELTALTGANLADVDAFAVVDTSAVQTKKITYAELKTALDTGTGFVRITGDTMTGALNVQSTITSDGLTVDAANSTFNGAVGITSAAGAGISEGLLIDYSTNLARFLTYDSTTGSEIAMYTQPSGGSTAQRLRINSGGDISFYENTGSTPKLQWSASNERLFLSGSDYQFGIGQGSNQPWYSRAVSDGSFRLHLNGTGDIITADSTGNLGIGSTRTDRGLLNVNHDNTGDAFNSPHIALTYDVSPTNNNSKAGITYATSDSDNYGYFQGAERTDSGQGAFVLRYHNNSASGTERMRIDSSGNVGIGTSLPSEKLHVEGSSPSIKIKANNEGGSAELKLQSDQGDDNQDLWSIKADPAHVLDFINYVSGAWNTRMRIDSSGNVGIGTTSIANESDHKKLKISGGSGTGAGIIEFADTSNNIDGAIFADGGNLFIVADRDNATADSSIRFRVDGSSEKMRIDNSGRVGIGTSVAPAQKLTVTGVSGANVGGLTNGILALTTGTGVITDTRLLFGIVDDSYAWLQAADYGVAYRDISLNPNGGNVGIGTASPAQLLEVSGNGGKSRFTRSGSSGTAMEFYFGGTQAGGIQVQGTGLGISGAARENDLFIDSSGRVLISKTANNFGDTGLEFHPEGVANITRNNERCLNLNRINNGGGHIVVFHSNGSDVGSIDITTSATSYNTSSDYRLKENVNYTWDATTRLKQLKPARFNFIVDDTNTLVDGFLAHEVSSIVPEAITGTKDAVDADGNPEYQGIDQSKLVPLLVKTIQELEARITALEA